MLVIILVTIAAIAVLLIVARGLDFDVKGSVGPSPATGTVRLTVAGAVGRRNHAMAIKPIPPFKASDIESIPLSLSAKLPDGSPDPGPFTWESSDPSLAQIVGDSVDTATGKHAPDPNNTSPSGASVWVLTPAGPGVVTITATSASANVDGNSVELTLEEGRTGSVNLSVGTPIPD